MSMKDRLEEIIWGGKENVPPYFKMSAKEKSDIEQEFNAQAERQLELTQEMIEEADGEWKTEPDAYKEDGEVDDHVTDYQNGEVRELNS